MILIVDDDEIFLEMLKVFLGKQGYDVRTARGGVAGLKLLEQGFKPDLILCDVFMAPMDGFAFATETIRHTSAPLVFISVADKRGEAVLHGASGFLKKPISNSQVVDAVNDVLHGRIRESEILIVDDAPEILHLYSKILKDAVAVHTAQNGEEGLAFMEKQAVDLILLDIQMPVMDGREFLRRLRANPKWRTIPVIVQSMDADAIKEPIWLELHAEKTLTKDEFLVWLTGRLKAILRKDKR